MAFPFGFETRLRQQLLLAIGTGGWLASAAMGCTAKQPALEQPVARGGATGTAGRSVAAGAGGLGVTLAAGNGGTAAGAGGVHVGAGAGGLGAGAGAGAMAGTTGGASAGSGAAGVSAGAGGGGTSSPVMCGFGVPEVECFSANAMKQRATFGCGMIATTPTPTEDQVDAKFLPNGCLQRMAACNGCCNPSVSDGVPQGDGSCCYSFCSGSCCGRPFVVEDTPRLAALEARGDWLAAYTPAPGAGPTQARIAAEWLEDARMEHASIASFARFTLDLLAYGAPAELVEAAQRAALDECEHARLCFGLAARFGAGERGPSPLPAAGATVAPSLWHAAMAAFHEGCVSETLAALHADTAAERAQDPEVKRALTRISADEARHAELAWRFVAWSAARLGADFKLALEREMASLCQRSAPVSGEFEPEAVALALRAAGRLTATDKRRLDHVGMREVIAPCLRALLDAQLLAVA